MLLIKKMYIFAYIVIIIIFMNNYICNNKQCFEYSCEECETEEYGKCTKCRKSFKLIDGTCPCSDSGCALCETGFVGNYLCVQCKNGYYNYNYNCYCNIVNCEQCSENICLKCKTNYYFNKNTKKCEKKQENIKCFDNNCKICFSEEEGACEECNEGYNYKKGSCYLLPKSNNGICQNNYFLEGGIFQEKCYGINCPNEYKLFEYKLGYTCPSNDCLICV